MITNTRETGKLEVQKDLSPSTDGGLFNLQIDGTTDGDATDVGDGGSTGEETLNTGDHTVGETAGTDTDLADYQKSIECRDDNGTGSVVASTTSDDAGPLTVPVTTGSDIVCVITNTRETGKLEVKKTLSPTTDPGKFDLQIDGTTDPDADDVGDSGSTGEETLNTGNHTVGEVAGTGTDLDDYQKSIECRGDNGTGAVVASVAADNAGPLHGQRHNRLRHRLRDHEHPRDRQARGAEGPQSEHGHRPLQPSDRRQLTRRRIAERR